MNLNPIITQPMFDADLLETRTRANFTSSQHNFMPTPKTTTTTRTTVPLVERHHPEAVNDFLRWQFGIHTLRTMVRPVYAGKVVTGEEPINAACTVFRLLGYGSTKSRALAMAHAALERLTLESNPA